MNGHDINPRVSNIFPWSCSQLGAKGKSNAETAMSLHLSPKTVETYRSRTMQKLAVHDLAGHVKFAPRHGVTGEE